MTNPEMEHAVREVRITLVTLSDSAPSAELQDLAITAYGKLTDVLSSWPEDSEVKRAREHARR